MRAFDQSRRGAQTEVNTSLSMIGILLICEYNF
jgi:hypothetical protein